MWDARCGICDEDEGYEAGDAGVGFGMRMRDADADGGAVPTAGRCHGDHGDARSSGATRWERGDIAAPKIRDPPGMDPRNAGPRDPYKNHKSHRIPDPALCELEIHGSRFPSQCKSRAPELRELFPLLDLAEGSGNPPSQFKTFPPGAILRAP